MVGEEPSVYGDRCIWCQKTNDLEADIILSAIKLYSRLKKYLHNTLWVLGDKITSLALGLLVNIVIARHLGPENFGIFAYAVSLTALFAAAGHVGLSGLVVREIVNKPDERNVILGTAFTLKFFGVAIGYFLLLIYAVFFERYGSVEFAVLTVAGAALLFKPFDIVDFWFQAFVQSRYVTYARLTSLFLSSLLKLLFVFLGFGVIFFAGANLFQSAAIAFAMVVVYKLKSYISISKWSFQWRKAKELFSQGWLIYLGTIFSIIYLKADQVMLRWFEGAETVGIYAVAVQLSEAWYFIPTAIVGSFFPKLLKLKEEDERQYRERLQQLLDLMIVVAFSVAVTITLSSEWIVELFFGKQYLESASVLVIHIWAAVFIFMRAVVSKWILIENVLVFSLITQGIGSVVNIILNYFLIPMFGANGAAYATLVSYAFASFLSLAFYTKTRPVFLMMLKAFLVIFRYNPGKIFK